MSLLQERLKFALHRVISSLLRVLVVSLLPHLYTYLEFSMFLDLLSTFFPCPNSSVKWIVILHSLLIHVFTVKRCRGRRLHLLRNIKASISFVLQPQIVPMLLLSPLLPLMTACGSSIAVLATPHFLLFVFFFPVYFVVNLLTVLYVTLAAVRNTIV